MSHLEDLLKAAAQADAMKHCQGENNLGYMATGRRLEYLTEDDLRRIIREEVVTALRNFRLPGA